MAEYTLAHIGINTENANPSTAKYKPDGTLNAIYLLNEVCGFAVHLVGNRN